MLRLILGVIIGYVVWSVVWVGSNQVFFAEAAKTVGEGEAVTDAGTLLSLIGVSVVCSLLGGLTSAKIGKERARTAVLVNGILLLTTGILVQMSAWSLMPAWYHLTFLALLIPVTLLGGKLGGSGAGGAARR